LKDDIKVISVGDEIEEEEGVHVTQCECWIAMGELI
jgi:hypothetical protein